MCGLEGEPGKYQMYCRFNLTCDSGESLRVRYTWVQGINLICLRAAVRLIAVGWSASWFMMSSSLFRLVDYKVTERTESEFRSVSQLKLCLRLDFTGVWTLTASLAFWEAALSSLLSHFRAACLPTSHLVIVNCVNYLSFVCRAKPTASRVMVINVILIR